MCKVISVVNQKGGVAKSTTTLNLGVGLGRKAKKILLNDGDSQGSKSIGKSGNESIVGFVGEGNDVMNNSVILVEKFDVQNFR